LPHRADDAEADVVGVRQPPDALWPLRVTPVPALVRAEAGGAATALRAVGPRAAPDDVRVAGLRRQVHRARRGAARPGGGVGVGPVLVEAPLPDVAVQVVQAPGVGLLPADRVGGLVGVLRVPGVLAEAVGGVAEGVRRAGAGAAGVLSLGLGRQAVGLAG